MPERGSTKPLAGTHFYVLLALADAPRYGLEIAEEVAARTGGEVRLGPGTLYSAIQKMLDSGLIEEWTPAEGSADPRRRYYRITRRGRSLVGSEAARLEQLVDAARDKRVLPGT